MENIGYNGKFFNNKDFRIKIKTGADINNATGNAIVGEMFLVTGESPALYIATETSTENSYAIHKVMDLTGGAVSSGSSAESSTIFAIVIVPVVEPAAILKVPLASV